MKRCGGAGYLAPALHRHRPPSFGWQILSSGVGVVSPACLRFYLDLVFASCLREPVLT